MFDFGQHFAGWCRLRATGPRGTRIELKFAELLTEAGEADQSFASMGEPKMDVFILRGTGNVETFEPHFAYRGFRYVQVEGLPATPTLQSLEGLFVHTDLPIAGRLRVGDPLIQQIWRNTVQTIARAASREAGWATSGYFGPRRRSIWTCMPSPRAKWRTCATISWTMAHSPPARPSHVTT